MENTASNRDVTGNTLAVLFVVGLIFGTFWVVRPFFTAMLWAAMIVVATWPILLTLEARFWGKRRLAAAIMTVTLLLVLIIPLALLVSVLVGNLDNITAWIGSLDSLALPPPPAWVSKIPLAGSKLSEHWRILAAKGSEDLASQVLPYAGQFMQWFGRQIGSVGAMILHFLLTVVICGIFYLNGEGAAAGVRRFAVRLGGANGEKAVILAANSVRGVAAGVVVTAIVQTAIAGIGFAITAVPAAGLLTAVVLFLCLAQLGPTIAMVPAVIWKFYSGDAFFGGVLLVFTLLGGVIDNILRPVLIRKGADSPLLLIFAGVIGGMISMGIVGIFVGPVILAIAYALLTEWIESPDDSGVGRVSGEGIPKAV